MSDGQLILVGGSLLVAGLAAALAAGRLRVPGLVLFLALGMAIGSDGAGWIDFDDYELARTIGTVALALILFEGGLDTGFSQIRPVLGASLSLALAGTLGTAVIAGLAAALLFDFSTLDGMLVGSIVAATDGAAIFGVLRGSTLRRRLARTLEGEAGFNDPVAVLLVIGFIDWIQRPDYGALNMALLLVRQLGIGLAVGLAVGWLGVQGLRRARLGTAGVYPLGTVGIAAVAYGAAATLHGSGFLAVYLAGLILGGATIPAKATVRIFHQGLGWVAQVTMFLVLGLLVFPSQLNDVAVEGTLLALILAFIARPAAAMISTAFSGYTVNERIVLGWAGLRGAVPVVLATFPVIEGVPHSLEFFNIVFFAVMLSTLVQGATFEPLARRLEVTTADPALGEPDPPPRPARSTALVSTSRPWAAADGDPAYPREVAGRKVVNQLRTRLDRPGALVELEDGRYAFTGPVLAMGSASALRAAARRRLERASTDSEREWWREVIGALAR
jgi:potassium/hydrogen antiporter